MLIGISGKAGTGKDTVADHLCKKHGYVKYSLATPIKAALCAMFGWHINMFEDRERKEKPVSYLNGKSPRQLAQTLGTDWGRELIDQDIWLTLGERFIRDSVEPVVIADIRFENEAALIRENGGTIIHLQRDVEAVAAHSSEAGIAVHADDIAIENTGTVKWLKWAVDQVMFAKMSEG